MEKLLKITFFFCFLDLSITLALPCKCRLSDYESSLNVEADIRNTISSNGLTLIGWYHSHPTAPPTPSIRDIEMQLDFELKMKGVNDSNYLPCIGFICCKFSQVNLKSFLFEIIFS